MPRIIDRHKMKQNLDVSTERLFLLANWISSEVDDALSARKSWEKLCRDVLRMYEGVPRFEQRDVPIENAPNIEVTIGAIAADTIYAQVVDLVFNTTPFVTARPKPKAKDDKFMIDAAKDLQIFLNHLATSPEVDLRNASENSILDDVQLGTAILYIPWVEKQKKTKTAKILAQGPRIRSMAPEDVLVPGGTKQSIDDMPFFGLRFVYTAQELADYAKTNNVNISNFQPLGPNNWVRTERENLGRHVEGVGVKGKTYDVYQIYCYFDIDGDGLDEDLLVIYNHSGRSIGAYSFNPMDRRPTEYMTYQRRAHLFYGMGVLEMMRPFEEKLSDIHNYATLNILLANSRLWVGDGSIDERLKIWPGKYISAASSDSLKPLAMADVYNSIWQDQMVVMQLGNQRVGMNDMSSGGKVPNRTSGITTMSMLQQVNRRFTPAFDSIRLCIAGALKQCLYRYQEQLLAGNALAMQSIYEVLGYESGDRVIELLRQENFDENVDVELSAASASVNREADRQNAILLTNLLGQYYQRTIELMMLAANPQTPPEVRTIAHKIASAASEVIERTIRTFDQVRDPQTFIIEMDNELTALEQSQGSPQEAMMQLFQAISGGGAGGQSEQLQLPERTMA